MGARFLHFLHMVPYFFTTTFASNKTSTTPASKPHRLISTSQILPHPHGHLDYVHDISFDCYAVGASLPPWVIGRYTCLGFEYCSYGLCIQCNMGRTRRKLQITRPTPDENINNNAAMAQEVPIPLRRVGRIIV